jgi:hypothetical protein
VKTNFHVVSGDPEWADQRHEMKTFEYSKGAQLVNVQSLDGYSNFRDPLNILVHETEEQYESEKTGGSYWDDHTMANEKELEITGKQEANWRNEGDYIQKLGKGLAATAGYTERFDYVDKNGNYIETRQGTTNNGFTWGKTLNKNTSSEQAEEQKFKTSVILKGDPPQK